MGTEPTKYSTQAILNYSSDQTVKPPLLQVGLREWNGTAWVKSGGGGVGTSGVKSLSSASTAAKVTASSTPCNYVDIVAVSKVVAVGDSSVQSIEGTPQGLQLYPGNPPYRIYVSDLTDLYAAASSGGKLCYTYY